METYQTIGTCSLCGGAVRLPSVWFSVVPPVPTCGNCGATKKRPHGPVIDMEPAPRTATGTSLRIGPTGCLHNEDGSIASMSDTIGSRDA